MKFITPGGTAPKIYGELIKENHLLIAGATGCGKSTLLNSLIARVLMESSPAKAEFIFIDLKRVELIELKKLPHTVTYADDAKKAVQALQAAVQLIEDRYRQMQKKRIKLYQGTDVYIVIDEYADLIATAKKLCEPLITRISQIGRAARVHLWISTQRPTREIITGTVKVNIDCKIALHTATAQDSRNIIGVSGAEALPRFGYALRMTADGLKTDEIKPIDPAPLVDWYTSKKCKG